MPRKSKPIPQPTQTVIVESAPKIELRVPDPLEDLRKSFKDTSESTLREVQNAKKDFISIFGLFAGVLIFLSLEVKIFDQSLRMATTMGISFFFLSSLITFALAIRNIYDEKTDWKEFFKPAFVLAVVFLILSLECFYWGSHTNTVTHRSQYWLLGSRG